MNASQLKDEHELLVDKCLITIAILMQFSNQVKLTYPVYLTKEPDVEITGIIIKSGRMFIKTRSFGILNNRTFMAGNNFFTVADYISVIARLEQQF